MSSPASTTPMTMDVEEINQLSRKELTKLCKQFNLKANGKNTELVDRLAQYYAAGHGHDEVTSVVPAVAGVKEDAQLSMFIFDDNNNANNLVTPFTFTCSLSLPGLASTSLLDTMAEQFDPHANDQSATQRVMEEMNARVALSKSQNGAEMAESAGVGIPSSSSMMFIRDGTMSPLKRSASGMVNANEWDKIHHKQSQHYSSISTHYSLSRSASTRTLAAVIDTEGPSMMDIDQDGERTSKRIRMSVSAPTLSLAASDIPSSASLLASTSQHPQSAEPNDNSTKPSGLVLSGKGRASALSRRIAPGTTTAVNRRKANEAAAAARRLDVTALSTSSTASGSLSLTVSVAPIARGSTHPTRIIKPLRKSTFTTASTSSSARPMPTVGAATRDTSAPLGHRSAISSSTGAGSTTAASSFGASSRFGPTRGSSSSSSAKSSANPSLARSIGRSTSAVALPAPTSSMMLKRSVGPGSRFIDPTALVPLITANARSIARAQPVSSGSVLIGGAMTGPKRNQFDLKASLSRATKGYVPKSGALPPVFALTSLATSDRNSKLAASIAVTNGQQMVPAFGDKVTGIGSTTPSVSLSAGPLQPTVPLAAA